MAAPKPMTNEDYANWLDRLAAVIEENPHCHFDAEDGHPCLAVEKYNGTYLGTTRAENLEALRDYAASYRDLPKQGREV